MEDALKRPGELVVNMLTPPPGTSPAVKGLYYAENAHLGLSVLKGSKKIAGGVVSKVLGKNIASNTMRRVTQGLLKAIQKVLGKAIAASIGKALTAVGVKLAAAQAALHTALAATAPVGTIIDAIITSIQMFGLIFMLFDKSGIAYIMDKNTIKNITGTMNKELDDAYRKEGMPGYYSDEAEFPVTDFVFAQGPEGELSIKKGWGDKFLQLQDEYMAARGFGPKWRDSVAAETVRAATPVTPPAPDAASAPAPGAKPKIQVPLAAGLAGLLLFLACVIVIGAIFYLISK